MPRTTTAFFSLIIAASIWCAPAFAVQEAQDRFAAMLWCAPVLAVQDEHNAAWGLCPLADDANYRMLPVADAGALRGLWAAQRGLSVAQRGLSLAQRGLAVGPMPAVRKSEDAPKVLDAVALRQDVLRPLPRASQTGNDGQKEQWVRLSDGNFIPEPGIWALLIAGFLGMCAVARPRIFSS